jgi:hypothetical protein
MYAPKPLGKVAQDRYLEPDTPFQSDEQPKMVAERGGGWRIRPLLTHHRVCARAQLEDRLRRRADSYRASRAGPEGSQDCRGLSRCLGHP